MLRWTQGGIPERKLIAIHGFFSGTWNSRPNKTTMRRTDLPDLLHWPPEVTTVVIITLPMVTCGFAPGFFWGFTYLTKLQEMAHTELSSSNQAVPNLLAIVGHMSCITL